MLMRLLTMHQMTNVKVMRHGDLSEGFTKTHGKVEHTTLWAADGRHGVKLLISSSTSYCDECRPHNKLLFTL